MGTKYIILQVFYKAFYEYSIRHSTGYSIVSSVKYIKVEVYNGAQGYGVEGWAHRKGRGLESG